jgi:hypothetical protein
MAKKKRVREGGALAVEDVLDILSQQEVMSKFDATCVRRGVIESRDNCLDDIVALAEKLAITHELVQ